MTGDLCAVLLAAGEGRRLRPLTLIRPKALCPVGNRTMLDRALAHVAGLGLTTPATVAVNAAWLGDRIVAHLRRDGRPPAHVSREPHPLGTTGGVARLRDWIDGRAVLVGNADAYLAGGDLRRLLDGWDGHRVRLLGVPAPPGAVDSFAGYRFAGFSLLPWHRVRDLPDHGELVRAVWRPAEADGELDVVPYDGFFRDTGTPADYLAANRHSAGGGNLTDPTATVTGACHESVVGDGAVVAGRLTRSVVWPGGYVAPHERLVDTVRVGRHVTVRAAGR